MGAVLPFIRAPASLGEIGAGGLETPPEPRGPNGGTPGGRAVAAGRVLVLCMAYPACLFQRGHALLGSLLTSVICRPRIGDGWMHADARTVRAACRRVGGPLARAAVARAAAAAAAAPGALLPRRLLAPLPVRVL